MSQRRRKEEGITLSAVTVALIGAGLVAVLFLLALLLVNPMEQAEVEPQESQEPTGDGLPITSGQAASGPVDRAVTLRVLVGDTLVEMAMSDYLVGVVTAEMPASFESEALKAQAVAARTYTQVRRNTVTPRHPEADVCNDYTCCQAYLDAASSAANWGDGAIYYQAKIEQAVAETDGVIACYEGEPIDAVFHSSAPGATLDAVAVWGSDIPYLKSVESPEGDEVPGWQQDISFTADEARAMIRAAYPEADVAGAPSTWLSDWSYYTTGTVEYVTLAGVRLKGTEVRALFGLRSATFSAEATQTNLTFHMKGYGHAVGMSQYGANTLAKQGKQYDEIICWYYTGVELGSIGA